MACGKVEWSETYSIGYECIDREHHKLFDLAADIFRDSEDKDHLLVAVRQLVKYTKFHFANEERYMKSIRFPDLPHHKELHASIVSYLTQLVLSIPTMSTEELCTEIKNFVHDSLIEHIIIEDKKVQHFRRSDDELQEIFQWKSLYKLDHTMIDDEHFQLFKIAMEATHYRGKNRKTHIRDVIMRLCDYMKVHFGHEEAYMREIGFPLLEEHQKGHEKIIDAMNHFILEIPNFNLEYIQRSLIGYIDIWLVNHIVHEDQKIACFTKRRTLFDRKN